MRAFLKFLVVLFLLLSVAAFILGFYLFGRRELLKGRTQKLERSLIALASYIEEKPATLDVKPEFTPRDISDCEAQVLDKPEQSQFWSTYAAELEQQNLSKIDLNKRLLELMQYYKVDPITQKIDKDPISGARITVGEGTMQNLLDEVLKKMGEQYNLLNTTRQQLKTIREELESTNDDLNKRKAFLRERLVEIVQLKAKIAELENEIAGLKAKIAELEDQIRTLEAKVAERDQIILERDETISERDVTISELKNKIEELVRRQDPNAEIARLTHVEPGVKGKVVSVNQQWNFVVMQLDPKFVRQILGKNYDKELPTVHLMIRRAGDAKSFVTKVKLTNINAEKLIGVGDILSSWQQAPVMEGDVVFY